ncbi:fatty acid synthase S-acetyltransferase [Sphaerosporella brunnea]|uniref:Fatty acid synthase S-acetyltransferase n=1 Tax=Sphaerosporella brunnea TaxID=1250544 RepID=A0A5J5EVH2_9PEZI|nr:fatty acid synthase S-acetyltransferase [Sphaerosporella brunnea]
MPPGRTTSPTSFPYEDDGSIPSQFMHDSGSPEIGFDGDKVSPIAVIGLSLKFCQDATSPEGFWQMLQEGRSGMTEVPESRYNLESFYHPDAERAGTLNVRGAHFVKDDLGAFDAPFFSMTPAEASCMDPQQRGLLETVYRGLENAGVPMQKAAGSRTSVYVGCFTREYEQLHARDPEMNLKYVATGSGTAMLSNRISWFYDLTGPSLTIDTACSSSLNAFHLACQSLHSGDANMSIVGGCNLFYNPETIIPLTNLGFLSPDAKCYSFDDRANGYARGEGFGVVVLKRLSDALRDGDTIRAVCRATGSNQDGKSPGITQPTRKAQATLIRETYATGGLDLHTTRFFEAHGTGTPVGDPIEASAIAEVFDPHRSKEEPLYVGAVKSNIGHLEGAAGIAGLIKTVLVLEKGQIPPNIWFENPNPKIPLDQWNIKFPLALTPWPTKGLRRASVNAFGYGGSNAHAVLEDAYNYLRLRGLSGNHRTIVSSPELKEQQQPSGAEAQTNGHTNGHANGHANGHTNGHANGHEKTMKPRMFVWSGVDELGVKRLATAYLEHLTTHSVSPGDEDRYLGDLSYTLAEKRDAFPWKSFTLATSLSELVENLKTGLTKAVRSSNGLKLGFVFTGQGAQWCRMGQELNAFGVFRNSLLDSDAYLKSLNCSWSLIAELNNDEESSNIHNPAFSQPLCAALQIALVDLMDSWGIRPSAVVGHSSGEIAAAYAVGGLSKQSALRVAYHRGVLSADLAAGSRERTSMMSVGLSKDEVQLYFNKPAVKQANGRLVVACINSPKNVTVSGSDDKVVALKEILDVEGIFARKLKVENAYHSPYMKEIAFDYFRLIRGLVPGDIVNGASMFSSVTGQKVSLEQLCQAEYWVTNMVSPVLFSDAISQLSLSAAPKAKKLGGAKKTTVIDHLVEVGPHAALRGSVRDIINAMSKSSNVGYDSLIQRGISALDTVLNVVGGLYCRGYLVKLSALNNAGEKPHMLVDLPEYPFNHSQLYWAESRLSKNFRFRKSPRHELLGAPIADWNPSEAQWRGFLRVNENPWIKDHRITGTTIYPGAGMLVMAIEASRQIANTSKKIKGYRIKEACFHKALTVPLNSDGIETHFYLRPVKDSSYSSSSVWNEFLLCSYEAGEWKENCRGTIGVEYEEAYTPVDAGREAEKQLQKYREIQEAANKSCNITISAKQVYELFSTVGLDLGPSFQCLTDVRYNKNDEAVATIQTQDLRAKMPKGHVHPHVIHPTILDSVLQLMVPAVSRGGKELTQVMIPTFIRDLWVSSELGPGTQPPVFKMEGYASAHYQGFREAECSIIASNPSTKEPWVLVEGFRATAVSSGMHSSAENDWRRLCFNLDWKPDIHLLDQKQASRVLTAPNDTPAEVPDKEIEELEFICFMYISKYIKGFTDEQVAEMLPHHQKYVSFMKHQLERYETGSLLHGNPEWRDLAQDEDYVQQLLDRIEGAHPDGKLGVTVGENVVGILTGKVDPLEILFKEKLVENVYRYGIGAEIGYEKLVAYLDAYAHKNADINILEIGAGTGGATLPILKTLMHHGEEEAGAARFAHYDYTDISAGFFEKAKELFKDSADRMSFRTLDIEEDPIQQGFEAEKYDIVLAANVIHATKSLDRSLQNARKLLKPGGKLILFEMTNPEVIRTGFTFGVLPGWWLSVEENRKWGPLMSQEDWDVVLRRNKFTGVDIGLADFPDLRNHLVGLMVSTAASEGPAAQTLPKTVIVTATNSTLQQSVAEQLMFRLEAQAQGCELISLTDASATAFEHKSCIFLPELEESLLSDISTEDYQALQKMIAAASGVLWLTQGGGTTPENPNAELVTGLARCIQSENSSFSFIHLTLDGTKPSRNVVDTVDTILKVFKHTALPGPDRHETIYAEKDGVLYIARAIEANYLNHFISEKTTLGEARLQRFGQEPIRPLKLSIASPGLLDSLQFVDDPEYERPILPEEFELEVKATGMNFLDIMIALGQVSNDFLGGECSGIVTRAGDKSSFKVGDRIVCIAKGAYKTLVRQTATLAARIPDHMSFQEAAALPIVYCTAYYALKNVAQMRSGETVLIHWGTGGVGQAAIQLAQLMGAEIFVTVGTEEKRDFIMRTYGVPESHIFSSRDMTFVQGVRRMTNGRGVDVVLNSMSGEGLRRSWECIAPFGRFIEVGKRDIHDSARLSMHPFTKNSIFASVDLTFMNDVGPQLLSELLTGVMSLAHEKKIGPPQPLNIYPYSKIEEAFRFMQSGKHLGKIVLEANKDDLVMAVPDSKPAYYFDENATYVISGGLGGLGRSVARWMASRKAKNLILLSRSGAQSDASKALVAELEASGVKIAAPKCDVSDEETLAAVIKECSKDMPPIKGCIQGSMVLRDSIFENMSLKDFDAAIKPKVQGSWNLHSLLPKDLDFFVLLSSASGVTGNRGQGNYCIGNAYQDALARHRTSLGLKAIALDLGMILSVGFAAENQEVMDNLKAAGFIGIREEEFLAMLDYHCNPNLPVTSPLKSQVVTGMETPAALKAKGIDEPFWMRDPLFKQFFQMGRSGADAAGDSGSSVSYEALLSTVDSVDSAGGVIAEGLVRKLSRALSIRTEDIDTSRPLHAYGVDSLVAVELRNWFIKEIGADVAVFDIMGSGSIAGLSLVAAQRSKYVQPQVAAAGRADAA